MKKKFLGTLIIVLVVSMVGFSYIYNSNAKLTGHVISEGKGIEIKGSDTMLQLVSNMAEEFSKSNNLKISVTGGGSGTGIASLINKEIDIAISSRKIKAEEIALAKSKGLNPIELILGVDKIAVIVHKDNKLSKLTTEQISSIFKGKIDNWKEVGGEDEKITLYGRQSTSGTYLFFMEEIVKSEYSPDMRNLEGNKAILEAVKRDKTGIGYIGLGYLVDETGIQVEGINSISISNGKEFISPLDESKREDYPIARKLYQYLSDKPKKDSEVYNFVNFELGEEGQKIVKNTGFIPLNLNEIEFSLKQIK
jgi:phosphate transport system substrate-binding protein